MKRKSIKQNRSDVKNMLRVRLTAIERKMIGEYADSKGLGASTWARMELLGIISRAKQPP